MNRRSPPALTIAAILVFCFIYAPLMVLVAYSLNTAEYGVGWGGFTLEWYRRIFEDRDIQRSLGVSLLVSIPTVLVSTALGTVNAFALYRFQFRGKDFYKFMLYIPLVMPSVVIGISQLLLFVFIKKELGILTIIFAHISFTVPLTTLVILGRMQRIDRTLEDAAMDLGADEITTVRRVTLPLLKPGIYAAALLAFPWSFNDFVITYFVAGVGASTLPIRVYSMIRLGVSPMVNALGTLIVLIPLLLVVAGILLERRKI